MPPSLRTRQQSVATGARPLEGTTVTLSGTFTGLTHTAIEKRLSALGASISRSIATNTSVLLTNESDYKGGTTKVKQAKSRNLPIVGLEWLEACETKQDTVSMIHFDFGTPRSPTLSVAPDSKPDGAQPEAEAEVKAEDEAAEPAPKPEPETETARPTRKKRGVAAVEDAAKEESAPKRARGAKKEAVADPPKEEPAPAKKVAAKKEVKKEAGKKAAVKKGAAKKEAVKAEEEADETEVQSPVLEDGTAVDGQVAKGRNVDVPTDAHCTAFKGTVYICPKTRLIYDAHLNQSNHSKNANKFYKLQLLYDGNEFKTWTRWGRVGEPGSNALLGDGSLQGAMKSFATKFKDKSGLTWEERDSAPKAGKYSFAQQNYEATEELEKKLDSINFHGRAAAAGGDDGDEPPSKLEPAVQDLMRLIFNPQYMNAAMAQMKYDARRLPLGKLSKVVIIKAYNILKDLTDLINDRTLAASKYGTTFDDAVETMSNQYYTYIPHDFGRSRIPVLNTTTSIKPEIELLDNLVDMKEASDLMARKQTAEVKVNKLDQQFQGLGLNEMSALDREADEFKLISAYLNESRGHTHHFSYNVESIFRIERPKEEARLSEFELPATAKSDRRLLWHGSRATNFGGILSQGLRIAPPEAPVSGYMFGKGIYLADMSSKSAGYTASGLSGGTGLLLLCEAELGTPMLELVNADSGAGQRAKKNGSVTTWGQGRNGPSLWKDAGCVHPSLAGVQMPDTTMHPGTTNVANAGLWYNEYICYDVSQVRLRYLLRVKM